jgi:hypothetical protein
LFPVIKCENKVKVVTPEDNSVSEFTVDDSAETPEQAAIMTKGPAVETLVTLYAAQFVESQCPSGHVMFATGLSLDVTKCTSAAKLQSTARCTTNCTGG